MNSIQTAYCMAAFLCLTSTIVRPMMAQPTNLGTLYSSLQAQEANFPLPQTTETITVANIDVSESNSSDPIVNYFVPTYSSGTHPITRRSTGPCTGNRAVRPSDQTFPVIGKGTCASMAQAPNIGGLLSVTNILHLNVEFTITGWTNNETATKLTITLGSLPAQTVPYGTTSIIFSDVTETSPQLNLIFDEGKTIAGVLPLKIDWLLLGAGAITIPVLPVSIVYAPIVDAQQLNTASAATGISTANTTTVSFSQQTGSTVPVDSSFQEVADVTQAMQAIGPVLQKIPNGIAQGVGTGLSTVAGLLGSSTATQTNTGISASQNTLQVGTSQTITQTAKANQGGPGVGDLITYYYNVRVVWFSDGQAMQLAVLGFDGSNQTSAGRISAALSALSNQPPGTIDPLTHLNADSLANLLQIDPFCSGQVKCDATAVLSGPRFIPITNGTLEISAGTLTRQYIHQFSTTDFKSTQSIVTNSETDKAGLLSFLGIGVTNNQTIQTTISQGTSLQNSAGATATQSFTFNSNGTEHYSCEIYFDVIFGAFAFRLVPDDGLQPRVTGTLVNTEGKVLPDTEVVAKVGSKRFLTESDGAGRFMFWLPKAQQGLIEVSASVGTGVNPPRATAKFQMVAGAQESRDLRLQLR
jgi:hypothetical protein